MKISYVEIRNFRNLQHISIDLGHRMNVFYGHNGSGKTSFLEAIYYLGFGRSFRTRHLSRIIHHDSTHFSIFCQLSQRPDGPLLAVGIERQKAQTQPAIKIGGKPASSLVEIANLLPMQLINADSHLLLTSGPLPRRQFLDWGVFHVEPSFYPQWQRANRIVKQRNAALKNARTYQEIALWDAELEASAVQLDLFRRDYIAKLTPILQPMLEIFLERSDFTLSYSPGWNDKQPLKESYRLAFDRDKQLGYTQLGPHRADLQLKINGVPVQDILSQGQQKITAYALRLSQGKLLHSYRKECLFLIDDLPSELDETKRKLISAILKQMDSQLLVTGIELEAMSDLAMATHAKRFHVEHGAISPI